MAGRDIVYHKYPVKRLASPWRYVWASRVLGRWRVSYFTVVARSRTAAVRAGASRRPSGAWLVCIERVERFTAPWNAELELKHLATLKKMAGEDIEAAIEWPEWRVCPVYDEDEDQKESRLGRAALGPNRRDRWRR